ncbi:elongation factor P hydroxylase [Teredinibacter sp. KSP-S5-2]|uniref:elongation factor P hydroxylase n=1 Tax=Teredinibacter sp. KSP-S5-2 TaxID=3034506 RepID=UPI002934C014|nr:elongation factor P hydroxylase [Teredinibacter sp. KSP-S5-2]WNO09921.1 elongation factor P hydroxylase [Teredinibacter sp. KSP-S5-2]
MVKQVQNPLVAEANQLVELFNRCFQQRYTTRLCGGGIEPVYRPQKGDRLAEIVFTHDYFASALHEVAHWCIAGQKRREQEDYGYWYAPDGRTEEQQMLFEKVEVKPQAMEWIFTKACGQRFHLSSDNLNSDIGASHEFKLAVFSQVKHYCQQGLPERARNFAETLAAYYQQSEALSCSAYSLEEIL